MQFRAAFLLAAMACLASCSKSPSKSPPADRAPSASGSLTPAAITARGELRVGFIDWDPCIHRPTPSAEPEGIYVDMVQDIAKALGVRVMWRETTLANFAAGLNARQFDFSVGPTFVTIPRAASVAFTRPIAFVGNSAVVSKRSTLNPAAIDDLNRSGIRVAVLQGQALDEFARIHLPQATLVRLSGSDLTAPLAAVSAGRADVGFMNTVTVQRYVRSHPELRAIFTGENQVELLALAWSTRFQDAELNAFLDSSLTYLQTTGRIAAAQRRRDIQLLYDLPAIRTVAE